MNQKLSTNILANFIGRVGTSMIGIIMVPHYIRFLGIESYGLVGFYSTLIGSMSLLDLGLSTTLNRELSRAKVENKEANEVRDLVFTLECLYWLVGLLIAIIVFALAPIIASYWIKTVELPNLSVSQAVMLMGGVVAFQWPISLYNGGLMGLEKQVADNIIMMIMTLLRSVGVILVLWLYSPTIQAFFIWQIVTSFLYVLTMRTTLWYYLPKSVKTLRFSKVQLRQIWRFAAGMTGITLATFFLVQIDKIVLSKILSLKQFAYYTLAFTVASSISIIVTPINLAVFPKLTALVANNDKERLVKEYHKACKLVATIIFPISLFLIFFAPEVIMIWTKNVEITNNISLMAQILVAGSTLNSLLVVPYLLMLAKGETKFTFIQNTIASLILVPLLFWWVHLFGSLGGTLVWLALNSGYVLISIPLIHKKFLNGELTKWYWNDTFLPLLAPLIILFFIKFMIKIYPNLSLQNLLTLIPLSLFVLLFSILFMKEIRNWVKDSILMLLK